MALTQTTVNLSDDAIREIDEFAKQLRQRTGMDASRAAAHRLVVDAGLRALHLVPDDDKGTGE